MPDEGEMRTHILEAVRAYPGIHFRALVRELDTSTALARYHLEKLLGEDELRSVEISGYVRYFPTDVYEELDEEEKEQLNVLRQEKPLEIVLALLEFGSMQHKDLHELVSGSKGTLTYHLNKLVDADIVNRVPRGDDRGFHLQDEERVRRLLARYRPESDVFEEIHDAWEDLFGGHRED